MERGRKEISREKFLKDSLRRIEKERDRKGERREEEREEENKWKNRRERIEMIFCCRFGEEREREFWNYIERFDIIGLTET